MFGIFKKAAKGIAKGVKGAVKGTVKGVNSAGKAVTKTVSKVPVIGPGLGAVTQLAFAPVSLTTSIVSGERIDKAVLGHLKAQVKSVKAVAPYAQSVITLVPGVGTGVGAALSAGLALADGQPINAALVAGVKGALPGGAVARAAFDVSEAVVRGKPIDKVALAAIPLPPDQKKVLEQGLNVARDLAKGKPVDKAVFERAQKLLPADAQKALSIGIAIGEGQYKQAARKGAGEVIPFISSKSIAKTAVSLAQAPVSVSASVAIGGKKTAVAVGPSMLNVIPSALRGSVAAGLKGKVTASAKPAQSGTPRLAISTKVHTAISPATVTAVAARNPKLAAALNRPKNPKQQREGIVALKKRGAAEVRVNAALQGAIAFLKNDAQKTGFMIGIGVLQQPGLTPQTIDTIRNQLNAEQRIGFNLAAAAKLGEATGKVKGDANPKKQFANMVNAGLKKDWWRKLFVWLKRPYLGQRAGKG
jgi:hypothetical protein